MHYSKLLKHCYIAHNNNVCYPELIADNISADETIINSKECVGNIYIDASSSTPSISSSLEKLQQNTYEIPENNITDDSTILNDDETNNILSMLLYFRSKYFSEIQLSENLCKKFVWNMPKAIYETAAKAYEYGYDYMNPIMLFYIFCAKDPQSAYGKFMDIMLTSIDDENFSIINSYAEEYDLYCNADTNDISEEIYDEEYEDDE